MKIMRCLKFAAGLLTGCIPGVLSLSLTCAAEPVPVYCFFNASEKDSFWTVFPEEKAALQNPQSGQVLYTYTGEGWLADTEGGCGRVPVYRLYNNRTKDHFYTISEEEVIAVEQNTRRGKDDYVNEGVAWYAYPEGSWPVYRFFDRVNFNHYYTADEYEKQALLAVSTFRYEGIGWYAGGAGKNGGSGNGSAGIFQLTASPCRGADAFTDQSRTPRARSDQEIVYLLNQALEKIYDPYGGFWVWSYAHQLNYNYYNNPCQRQPSARELWCCVGKSQGEAAIEIANAYVDIYTGTAVFDFIGYGADFVESSFPCTIQLW